MIINLRYHLDGAKLLVRWNYRGVAPTVTATCSLHKRLNGEQVAERKGITLEAYQNGGGGCSFELPRFPVEIRVYEDNRVGEYIGRAVTEAPRYLVQGRAVSTTITRRRTVRAGLFGLRNDEVTEEIPAVSMTLTLSDLLSESEVQGIPAWLFPGRIGRDVFFWLKQLRGGVNRVAEFPIADENKGEGITFTVAEEAACGTRFEGLFTCEQDPYPPKSISGGSVTPIDLSRLRKKDESGRFYPVVCPFCLEEYPYHMPQFRAKEVEGFSATMNGGDRKLKAFYERVGGKDPDSMKSRSAVLGWLTAGEDEEALPIRQYRLLGAGKDEWIDYDGTTPPAGVVAGVKGDDGIETTDKICPCCHNRIPMRSGMLPSVIISMMGNTGCGKTVYIARLVQMIREGRLLPGYHLQCRFNGNTATTQMKDVYDALEGRGRTSVRAKVQSGPASSTGAGEQDGFGGFSIGGQVAAPTAAGQPGAAPGGNDFGSFGAPADQGFGGFGSSADQGFGGFGVPADQGFGSFGTSADQGFGSFGTSADQGFGGFGAPADQGFGGFGASADQGFGSANGASSDTASNGSEKQPAAVPGTMPSSTDFTPISFKVEGLEQKPERCVPESTGRSYREPIVLELSAQDPKDGGLILTIYDYPGEAIWDRLEMTDIYKQGFVRVLNRSDGLVFLFDPMTIRRILDLGKEKRRTFAEFCFKDAEQQGFYGHRPIDVLTQFSAQYFPGTRVDVPTVYAISKSDAIRDHLPELLEGGMQGIDLGFLDESTNSVDSSHVGVDLKELESSNRAIRAFLQDEHLARDAEQLAERSIWMCVSATGIAPIDGSMDGCYGGAVRVLDPIEWILEKLTN